MASVSVATRNRIIDEAFDEVYEQLRLLKSQALYQAYERKNTVLRDRVRDTRKSVKQLQLKVKKLQRHALVPSRNLVTKGMRKKIDANRSLHRLVKLRTLGVNKRMYNEFLREGVERELNKLSE